MKSAIAVPIFPGFSLPIALFALFASLMPGALAAPPDLSLWPAWAFVEPTNVIHAYPGEDIFAKMNTLQPGDKMVIHAGTYSKTGSYTLQAMGTAAKPIFIEGAAGESAIITRPNCSENNFHIDNSGYLSIRNIKFLGGSIGMRIYNGSNILIEDCEIYNTCAGSITANNVNTSYLYFMHNHIHNAASYEGFYLGSHSGSAITHHTVVYNNYIHDMGSPGVYGSEGVEIKTGSYANLVRDNVIVNVASAGILGYGTEGGEKNVFENNIVINSLDNGIQVQGDAVLRNNIVINSAYMGIFSMDHVGTAKNLEAINNTLINNPVGVRINNFGNREGMVLANNVIYSPEKTAVMITNGITGGILQGNIAVGTFPAEIAQGVAPGNSISEDFVNPGAMNYYPKTLLFAGRSQIEGHNVAYDFLYQQRGATVYAGAFEKTGESGYAITPGFMFDARSPADANCGNNAVDAGENCASCPQDAPCSAGNVCQGGTCVPQQECVSMQALMNYISQWKSGGINMAALMQKIAGWKSGAGC